MAGRPEEQDRLFGEAAVHIPALHRLARGYEANPDLQRDLVQDIQLALWRSFAGFDGRCSLRTWVYRVGHNIGASHVLKERRARTGQWISLDHAEHLDDRHDVEAAVAHGQMREKLLELIHSLAPPDRQVILLYLEGLDAATIGEIASVPPAHVATRVQRLNVLLNRRVSAETRP